MPNQFVLMISIVDEDKGSDVMKIAHEMGVSGGTVMKAEGSVQGKILNMLGFTSNRKEMCLNLIKTEKEDLFYKKVNDRLHIDKAHHGVVFSLPVEAAVGLRNHDTLYLDENRERSGKMDAIFTIVDSGLAEDVIAEAKLVGAKGGTVIHARGSGIENQEKLFNFVIEPEKEIIFILSEKDQSARISKHLNETFKFEEEGKGILFVIDVKKAIGTRG